MRRPLLLLLSGLAVGCAGDPPPVREAAPVSNPDVPRLTDFHPPAKPDKSDPAAAKLLADAVKAHVGTDGATLAKLKAASVVRTGLVATPDGGRATMTCELDLLAPGRFRAENTLRLPGWVEKSVFVITPARGSKAAGGQKVELPPLELRDIQAQEAEDELLLLYPFTDPATVALPAPDATVNGRPARGAFAWTPVLAPALLHFDKETGRLVRVVYRGREQERELPKEITVTAHGQFGGVWLPTKYELRVNGRMFMNVEKQTYEIGKTFDPSRFVP